MSKPEYLDLFAWFSNKKTKIGYAFLDEKTGVVKIRAEKHLDASKIGRALLNGSVQIEQRRSSQRQYSRYSPKVIEQSPYDCAADDFDPSPDANQVSK